MAHSFSKIWLHLVFSTKNREPLIKEEIENETHQFLWKELNGLGCPPRIINGMPDHVHLLFRLNPQKSVADVVKQIKGSSSHWINQSISDNSQSRFAWQTGYGVFSVSESQLVKIEAYIKEQKDHHKKYTFIEEYKGFLKAHGLEWVAD